MTDNNKLKEEIIKADIKEVERLWKSNIENNSLECLLEKMTKEELVKIAKKYSVKGLTSLKKADVVDKMKEVILERYIDKLEGIDEGTLNFIEELLENNGQKTFDCNDIIYSNYLRNRGIVFTGNTEDELVITTPKELLEKIKAVVDIELKGKSKINTEIIKTIAGMCYYYGVVKVTELVELLNRTFNETYNKEFVDKLIASGEELGYDFVLDGDFACNIDVENIEAVIKGQEKFKGEYYKFDKKTLIKAGVPDFIEENKHGEKLKKVLKELFVIDNNILREEMDSFIIAIKNQMHVEEAVDSFLEAYEIESDEEREIFKEELRVFAKSIRRWNLKGYSEDEMEKDAQRVINEVKIGRNDPCMCGSSKKYKKCCGK